MPVPKPHDAASAVLRDATLADVSAVVTLTNAAYAPRDGIIFGRDRADAESIGAAIQGQSSAVIVAVDDDAVVAAVVVGLEPPNAHFGPLATAPEHQGRGLAPALIDECERRARIAGCTMVHIGVIREVGMQPYYEALGYGKTGETPSSELSWGEGTPHPFTLVMMAKALS